MAVYPQFVSGQRATAAQLNVSSIPVVSATADITSPFTGQFIFNTTDLSLYYYTGTVWKRYPEQGIGDWTKTGTQNLGNGTNDKVQFQQANVTAVGITKVDTGTVATGYSTFTINTPGLWSFNFDARFGTTVTCNKYIMIGDTAAGFYAKSSNYSAATSWASNLSVSLVKQCILNEQICCYGYNEAPAGTLVREGTTLITRFTATQLR